MPQQYPNSGITWEKNSPRSILYSQKNPLLCQNSVMPEQLCNLYMPQQVENMEVPFLDLPSSVEMIDDIHAMDLNKIDMQELEDLELFSIDDIFDSNENPLLEHLLLDGYQDSCDLITGADPVLSPGPKQLIAEIEKSNANSLTNKYADSPINFFDIDNLKQEDIIFYSENNPAEDFANCNDFIFSPSAELADKYAKEELDTTNATAILSLEYEKNATKLSSLHSLEFDGDNPAFDNVESTHEEEPAARLQECISMTDIDVADFPKVLHIGKLPPPKERRTKCSLKDMSEADKYRRIREQNNTASRKCRVKRKALLDKQSKQVKDLEDENERLKKKFSRLRIRRDAMKKLFGNFILKAG